MPEVRMPDGTMVKFPDNMPAEQIKGLIAQKFPQQVARPNADPQDQPARFSGAQGDVFSAMQGAMFNLGDELAAGATALGSKIGLLDKGISYDKALGSIREMQGRFGEEHGGRALVSTIAGAIPTAIATAPLAAAALPARLAQGTNLGARLGQATATGVMYGVPAGFGNGRDGLANRAGEAATGGVIGAVTGVAGQGIAEVAKPLLRYGMEGGRQALEAMGRGTPENMANRAILNAAQRAGISPDEMLSRMQQSEVPLSMADVGGVPMQRLSRAVATQEGPGSDVAIKALSERQAGRGDRLVNAFRQYVTPMDDATQAVDDIVKARAAQGRPDYEAAMAVKPEWTPTLERFTRDPVVREGLQRGREIQRLEALAMGEPFDPNNYRITGYTQPEAPAPLTFSERSAGMAPRQAASPEAIMEATPNMRALQAAKIGLDDMLEGYRDPVTGRMNLDQKGRALEMVRRSYLEELNRLNPQFAEANRNWSDATGLKNAVERGRSFLRGDVDLNERAIAGLTEPEKAMFRVGAARELRRQVETTRGSNDALRKFFGSPEQNRRLRALFDNDADFRNFQKVLLDEQLAQRTEGAILGGSQTANKQQELNMLAGADQIPTSASNLASRVLGGISNLTIGGARTRRAEKLAPLLYGTNTGEVADQLLRLQMQNVAQISGRAARGRSGDNARNILATILAGQGTSQ